MSLITPFAALAKPLRTPALFVRRSSFAADLQALANASNIEIENTRGRQDANGLFFAEKPTTGALNFQVTRAGGIVSVSPGVVSVAGAASTFVLSGEAEMDTNLFVGVRFQARPKLHSTAFGPFVVTGFTGEIELAEDPLLVVMASYATNPLPLPDFASHTWSADPAYGIYTVPIAWVGESEIIQIINGGLSLGLSAWASGITPGIDLEVTEL